MTYVAIPASAGAGLVAGSEHDLLGGLTDDDHTIYALLAGRAGGQTQNGGTASGEHLTLVSTAHATKGQVRIGSSTGLVHDGPSGSVGIGSAPDTSLKLKVNTAADARSTFMSSGSNVSSILTVAASASETEAAYIHAGSNDEAGTVMGVNKAVAAMFYGGSAVESVVVGGIKATSDLMLAPGNSVKATINQDGDWTYIDAADFTFGTGTGSKIGTATGEKIGFWGVTPVVQPVLATGAGATADNIISMLQTVGICKQA